MSERETCDDCWDYDGVHCLCRDPRDLRTVHERNGAPCARGVRRGPVTLRDLQVRRAATLAAAHKAVSDAALAWRRAGDFPRRVCPESDALAAALRALDALERGGGQ